MTGDQNRHMPGILRIGIGCHFASGVQIRQQCGQPKPPRLRLQTESKQDHVTRDIGISMSYAQKRWSRPGDWAGS